MNDDYELLLSNLKFSIDKNIIDENLEVEEEYLNVNNIPNGAYFDIDYYRKNYLNDEKIDPIKHYLEIGADKGFNPNEDFDTKFYIESYPAIKNAGYNPLVHYIKWGLYEGKLPKLLTLDELFKQNLKKCVKGKNGYLFLINDGNSELHQHFDKNFVNRFSLEKSFKVQKIKKAYLENKNIKFYSFGVPDKSVVCKEYLPFKVDYMYRELEERDDIIDLNCDELQPTHYSKSDTHTNYEGGKLLAFKILNYIDDSFNAKDYENCIKNSNEINVKTRFDLSDQLNWSYSYAELTRLRYNGNFSRNYKSHQPIDLEDLSHTIPKEFKTVKKCKSIFYRNKNSVSKLRVLLLHDSTMTYMRDYLSFYFREMFLYWDHGLFNRELVEWFEPDLVLEIRIERFIRGVPTPKWIEEILKEE